MRLTIDVDFVPQVQSWWWWRRWSHDDDDGDEDDEGDDDYDELGDSPKVVTGCHNLRLSISFSKRPHKFCCPHNCLVALGQIVTAWMNSIIVILSLWKLNCKKCEIRVGLCLYRNCTFLSVFNAPTIDLLKW